MAKIGGQLIHLFLINSLNRFDIGLLVESEQKRQLLGLDGVRIIFMSLKSVREDNFADFKLKCFDVLLLLILRLLLSVGSNAAFDDDVMIVVELALLLQSASFEDFIYLQIA
jgi:hypothetical protein